MKIPYIGITDFSAAAQVQAMLAILSSSKVQRRLHVGVMMSFKTLHDKATKWAPIFPPKGSLASIFSADHVMNCLHFADYEDQPNLAASLDQAVAYCGPRLRAIQLDMIWPDPVELQTFRAGKGQNLEIILQIGKNAMEACQNSEELISKKLELYSGSLDYVLLDKSMGQGKGMDAVGLLPLARRLTADHPRIQLAAAGGLGPDSVELIRPLLLEFPQLSMDAQGKLRPSGNAMDPVDWEFAGTYLRRAVQLIKDCQ